MKEENNITPNDNGILEGFEGESTQYLEETSNNTEDLNYEINSESAALEMDEDYLDNQTEFYFDEDTPSDEPIGGWLALFLYLGIGGGIVLTAIQTFSELAKGNLPPLLNWLFIGFTIVYFALGIFTITAFHKRNPDAVALAKTFVVITFISGVVGLIGEDYTAAIRTLIWSLVWFAFLCTSTKTERIIPRSYRKFSTRCWILIIATCVLAGSLVGAVIWEVNKKREGLQTMSQNLLSLNLAPGEYSNGEFIVKIPEGFNYSEQLEDGMKILQFSSSNTNIVMYGTYESFGINDFNDTWKEFEKGMEMNIQGTSVDLDINIPYELFARKGKIYGLYDNSEVWLVSLYDKVKDACCIMIYSGNDSSAEEEISTIIKSVRFL